MESATSLNRFGGLAFVVSGLLFLVLALLDLAAGPPPSNGEAILAWVTAHRLVLAFVSETTFFAVMTLIPGLTALYHHLASVDRVKAVTGCGIFAVVVPVLAILLIVHGRLIYPVYGIRAHSPDSAELLTALYYGGLHAVGLLAGIATVILSLAMRRSSFARPVVYLGFATGIADVISTYPWAIGPVVLFICEVFFGAWFVAVGVQIRRAHNA